MNQLRDAPLRILYTAADRAAHKAMGHQSKILVVWKVQPMFFITARRAIRMIKVVTCPDCVQPTLIVQVIEG